MVDLIYKTWSLDKKKKKEREWDEGEKQVGDSKTLFVAFCVK